jgi:TetR/AcrR family tetracycline transcriptional repressor
MDHQTMRKNGTRLTRDHILQAALKILDEQGLAGLSMRKLASTLNVEAMSLYNHIKDKQDLLSGLADLVLSQIELPDASQPWSQRLETIALNLYGALIRHPAVVIVLATEQGSPNDLKVMRGIDFMIAALAESGLSPRQQVNAYRGLLAMCFGFVFAHTQGLSKTIEQAQEEWDNWSSPQWNADILPHLARLAPYFMQTHADDDFQFMLRAYLDYLHAVSSRQEDLT